MSSNYPKHVDAFLDSIDELHEFDVSGGRHGFLRTIDTPAGYTSDVSAEISCDGGSGDTLVLLHDGHAISAADVEWLASLVSHAKKFGVKL